MITSKELTPFKKKVNTLVAEASLIKVIDRKSAQSASVLLSTVNKYLDSVTEKKNAIVKPIKAGLKEITDMFKTVEEPAEEAVEMLRSKLSDYQTEEVERERREKAAIAARVAPGKGNLSLETAVDKMAEIDTPEKTIATEEGAVTFVEQKKFEVMDMALLPIEYHLADEIAIRKAMKEGVELPGVRYYSVQVPRNTR